MKREFRGFSGKIFKVSKRFYVESDYAYYFATGSANDILKVKNDLERAGLYNLHSKNPVLRADRTYCIMFPISPSVGNRTYAIW